jgi:hypothetical protein
MVLIRLLLFPAWAACRHTGLGKDHRNTGERYTKAGTYWQQNGSKRKPVDVYRYSNDPDPGQTKPFPLLAHPAVHDRCFTGIFNWTPTVPEPLHSRCG